MEYHLKKEGSYTVLRKALFVSIALFCFFGTAFAQSLPANTINIIDLSGTIQTNRPISVSRVFRQGEIQNFAQASINGSPVLTQCDVKNRWPDGSLKFAIVSFIIPTIPANGSVTISFSNQATGNNTGFLTQTDMLAAGYNFDGTIEMTGANTQTVSARAMLSAGAFRYWLQGPIVTAVIIEDRMPARAYDKDFGDGSKALHPIFEAWFYPQGNKVDLGYTIENTWASSTASKGMRDFSYSLIVRSGSSSATVEFTQASFNHIGKSRWHKRFWLGADPGAVNVDHNIKYLVTTKAIPNYDTGITISESLIASQYSSWTGANKTIPGNTTNVGNYSKAMNATGESPWIGLLTTWDTIYLFTMDKRMAEMSLGNADLAGRMPMHFREADTSAGTGKFFDAPGTGTVDTFGRTISINARKQITLSELSQDCSGTLGADKINLDTITDDGWGTISRDHMPDVAYIPYLTTGRYYYLEEMQYWASYVVGWKLGCYSGNFARQGEAGYLNDSQVRGDAWGFRTLAYAAFLSPDSSPEKTYYEDKLKNNIAEWEGEHNIPITDTSKQAHWTWGNIHRMDSRGLSPLGSWRNRGSAFNNGLKQDGSLIGGAAHWEENFLAASLGMAKQFGYSTNALLKFLAKMNFHLLLDSTANKYTIESYMYPTIVAITNNWVQTWPEFTSYYNTVPTGWTLGASVDHGYGFIALAAISFEYDQTVDGYTGKQAWDFFKAAKPEQDRFATVSPKWAILPRITRQAGDIVPPAAPKNLKAQ